MKDNRREFIKKGASLAAALSVGGISTAGAMSPEAGRFSAPKTKEFIKDAGMQLCEAYFFGMEQNKIEFSKQMDVFGVVAGSPATYDGIIAEKAKWEKVGLQYKVVEGPPSLGNKTKLGLEGRDQEIEGFISFMQAFSKAGLETVCYNWMPVISWYRTNMAKVGRGGALVTAFDYNDVKDAPHTTFGEVSKETLWKNLEYFLKAVVPEAEKLGIKLAMHPDDPQVDSIKGISRIMNTVDNFKKLIEIVPSPSNGITMCQGNFSLMENNIPALVKYFGKRGKIHFVHFRNVRGGKFKFEETFHDEGQIDMYAAMQAYYDIGFKGPIRPDHVPTMYGDSNKNAGYSVLGSLYAWGYIRGLMESVVKEKM
jgi:mannonate dehydratase